jgi:hypothetical protein
MHPLTLAAATGLTIIALHSGLAALLLHASALLLYAHTTPVWRVETLYATVLKLLVSAATVFVLMRALGTLVVLALPFIPPASSSTTARKRRLTAIAYIYSRVTLYADPAAAPARVRDCRCSVCLEEGSSDVVLACGHVFHWDCVRPWLDARNACPLCRMAQRRRGVDAEGRIVA